MGDTRTIQYSVKKGAIYNLHGSNALQGIDEGYVKIIEFLNPSDYEDAITLPEDIIIWFENMLASPLRDYLTGECYDKVPDDPEYASVIQMADNLYDSTWVGYYYLSDVNDIRHLPLVEFVSHITVY